MVDKSLLVGVELLEALGEGLCRVIFASREAPENLRVRRRVVFR